MKLPDVIKLAKSHVGSHGRPNKFSSWYSARHGRAFEGAAWCDMFVSYIGNQAGMIGVFGESAYCPSHVGWFKARGRWSSKPAPGAVVFYDWDNDHLADHVGLVIRVLPNGNIEAIEGNTTKSGEKNQVAVQTRKPADILGYGLIAYSSDDSRTHVVKAGETLSKIAQKYDTTWQTVFNMNKTIIGPKPDMIRPGQRLQIPS